MVCRVRADRERQPMAIHNRHDFHAFSALRWSDLYPSPSAITNVASMKHSSSSSAPLSRSSLATSFKSTHKSSVAVPSLKASMHSFVVRIALRQHVPLRTCVENRQYRFQTDDQSGIGLRAQHAHREYAPPEMLAECAPTVCPSAEIIPHL